MPIDPLTPVTDIIAAPSAIIAAPSAADGSPGSGLFPLGVSFWDPFSSVTQGMWDTMDPLAQASYISQIVTGGSEDDDDDEDAGDDDGGNFNPGASLDVSQVMAPEVLDAPPPPARGGLTTEEAKRATEWLSYRGVDDVGLLGEAKGTPGERTGGARLPTLPEDLLPPDGAPPQTIIPGHTLGIADALPGTGHNLSIPAYAIDANEYEYATDDPQRVTRILDVARSMIGKPYIWGGEGPNGADCSGLVQMAYRAAGVELPRLAGFQMNAGKRVPVDQLRPGDLVGWDWSNLMEQQGSVAGADHIGIYIGDGYMIEAAKTGIPIRVTNLRDKDNQNMWGVRIPTSKREKDRGGITLSASERRQAVEEAVGNVRTILDSIFGNITPRKKDDDRDGRNRKRKKRGSGGNRDSDSKFYGSEKKDSGNSSKKYSGIGATK